ncbi:Na+/H+ antiporter subunit G [Salipiger abyssi]|uniref:Multisubunit potassium/proton antiporter, PhaG subunit n=1 Tax=Salipiger abyssi TaxID=1250539 RepID=A0A1P8UVC8_9RHOB|nr:Na+/H+ antiporter subunit G [Salipiger abyssi]APZ53341.1 multisubunit potassium/proton antiporter, PhaG subunit [Salipiger abyssi]
MDQDMTLLAELLVSAFLIVGGIFGFVGSFGLLKLKHTMQRLHAPTKATTLGVGGALIGSMLYFLMIESSVSFHELLITLFLFITAPITANFVAKTFMQGDVVERELPDTGRAFGWAVYDDPPSEKTEEG